MNFHTHIQPQLNEIIADTLSEACPDDCLLKPLSLPNWWTSSLYKDMPIRYEKLECTIEKWMSAFEAATGDNSAFEATLKQQIADTIEYQWQVRLQERAEDARYEHNLIMEYAEVVGL